MKKFNDLFVGERYTLIAPNGEEGGTVYIKIVGEDNALNTETYTVTHHTDDTNVYSVDGFFEIEVEIGNGYHCGCCRRTYEETFEYRTLEDVVDKLCRLYAGDLHPRYEDEDDISVEDVKCNGESIYNKIGELPQELVDKYSKRNLELIEERNKKANKAQREADLKELAALKAKYPDSNPDF